MIAWATEGHHESNDDVSVTITTEHHDRSHEAGDDNHFTPAKKPNISVGVPAIAFTKDIVSTNGRVRAPVLINASERPGTATLVRDGVPTSCSVQAQPGVVAWLQCSLSEGSRSDDVRSDSRSNSSTKSSDGKANEAKASSHTYSVVVRTSNGLTASHAITIG